VDAVQRDGGQVLRVPARFVDRARLLRVAAREGHIVRTIRKQPSEGGAQAPAPTTTAFTSV
jgi:hypothetical protein